MQKFQEWYYLECVYVLNFVEAKIPGEFCGSYRNIFSFEVF
jgi:hypothetical protein